MSSPDTAAVLRRRAADLRQLAATIEQTPATTLEYAAGEDTWRGQRPDLCRSMLVANLAQLHAAVDDLRGHAWQLARRADQVEVASALAAAANTSVQVS
jgi:1,2-phenylacetyl-CoA epoxidase catalytic subunit